MMRKKTQAIFMLAMCLLSLRHTAQPIPSEDEKIPFLCTFSKDSNKEWGDDDFVQIFFFVVPESYKKPIYIRVYDPDIGGSHDENHAAFNSKSRFSVYGGPRAHSDPAAKSPEPSGNYKSGVMMASKTYGNDKGLDGKWVTLGPFNPVEGELQPEMGGRVFKLVVEGMEGDDGNLYKIFLSSLEDQNNPIEGGNGFAYEYSFRLADKPGAVSHLYPFIAENVTAVKIRVFDYDDDGLIRVVSVAKKGDIHQPGRANSWVESIHKISKPEINTSLDVQFIKQHEVKNNNIVVFISNQYGELMPFFTSPIGGVPKFAYKIGVTPED